MKTFKQFLAEAPDIRNILNGYEKYWAHIHVSKPQELLHEHINLVNVYALRLVEIHKLDRVLDSLLSDYTKDWEPVGDADFLKKLFVHAIVFHDFGKINENFQVERMHNTAFITVNNSFLKPPYGHSYLGAFLFIVYQIDVVLKADMSQERRVKLICHCFFFAYTIMQHHSSALYDVLQKEAFMMRFKGSVDDLKRFIYAYGFNFNGQMLNNIFAGVDNLWHKIVSNKMPYVPFPLYALLKLNFSMLTASDYLSTHEYMNSSASGKEAATTDFGLFSRERVYEMIQHFRLHKHNAQLYMGLPDISAELPTTISNDNLNKLRQSMAAELIQTIRNNQDKKLFYIEAPTGGGKTNLSIIAVTELMAADAEIRKVYFVFPYTTLITQTLGVLKESLGLSEDEIVELHSKSSFNKGIDREQEEDGIYGQDKKDYVDRLFALYPLILMSHVKFFDILKTNKKESNYLLHRLSNSVVVIDEIQSYNPLIWDKMLYFISNYAQFFNIRFILMSATLPKISELDIGLVHKPAFVDLLPNAMKYISNENFSKRVKFNFDLFQNESSLEDLVNIVLEKSKQYAQLRGSVRTIIEFIYKRSASDFEQLLSSTAFFDKVFVLSGTVLDSRRKEIINFIKRTSTYPINILLITTQVVEAGVDIDMDLGFKNVSLLDSDEQLAGRVNRNARKEGCEVYLFKLDDASVLYGKDYRYKETRENIPKGKYQEILTSKDFKQLYEKVISRINKENNMAFKDNFKGYESYLWGLNFPAVDDQFKIIDQENQSVFVPLKLPIWIDSTDPNQQEAIFSEADLEFLSYFDISPFDGYLDGEDVWKLYENLISTPRGMVFDMKTMVNFKKLQGIMSRFCFSLLAYSRDYKNLLSGFGEERFGYLYFSYWDDDRENGKPYTYQTGLNNRAFSDANFI